MSDTEGQDQANRQSATTKPSGLLEALGMLTGARKRATVAGLTMVAIGVLGLVGGVTAGILLEASAASISPPPSYFAEVASLQRVCAVSWGLAAVGAEISWIANRERPKRSSGQPPYQPDDTSNLSDHPELREGGK